jgi:hypothetical protein
MILTLRHPAVLPVLLLLGACSHSTLNPPSLAPRAAEKIDPRVPVERALIERPMSGGIRERLASLMAQARSGNAAYRAAPGQARGGRGRSGAKRKLDQRAGSDLGARGSTLANNGGARRNRRDCRGSGCRKGRDWRL